jgi:hypothetical protein
MEVIGRAQQFGQNYCSRINYVRVIGTPLYNTVPRHLPLRNETGGCCSSVDLDITADDPIQQRGGIRKCSENGRPADEDEMSAKIQGMLSSLSTIIPLEGPLGL